MSINKEVVGDIQAAKKIRPSAWLLVSFGAVCLVVYFVADRFGLFDKALPLIDCAIAFGFLILIKWSLRQRAWFWAVVLLLAFIHGFIIWFVPAVSGWIPAVVASAIISADFCLMLWIIAAVRRRIEGTSEELR